MGVGRGVPIRRGLGVPMMGLADLMAGVLKMEDLGKGLGCRRSVGVVMLLMGARRIGEKELRVTVASA